MGVQARPGALKLCAAVVLLLALTDCAEREEQAAERAAQANKTTTDVGAEAPLFQQSALDIESGNSRHHFTIELAATPLARQRGLMFRQSMAADTGMLFNFEKDRQISMWMKNTFIPLDMLFIDAGGTIVSIAVNTTPHSMVRILSGVAVRAVLEVNAGTTERLGIKPGNTVLHEIFGNVSTP